MFRTFYARSFGGVSKGSSVKPSKSTPADLKRCWILYLKCLSRTALRAGTLFAKYRFKRLAHIDNVKNLSLWKELPVFFQTCLTVRFSLKRSFSHYAPSLLASFSGMSLLTASINLLFTFY